MFLVYWHCWFSFKWLSMVLQLHFLLRWWRELIRTWTVNYFSTAYVIMSSFAQAICLLSLNSLFIYKTTVFIWMAGGGFVCFSRSVTQCRNYSMEWWTPSRRLLFVFGCTRSECSLSECAVKQHRYKHVHANIDSWTLSFLLSLLLPLARTHKFTRCPWGPGQNVNLSTWLLSAAGSSMLNSQQHLLVETGTENI